MNIIELNLPVSDYHMMISSGKITDTVRDGVRSSVTSLGDSPALVGKSRSADAMDRILALDNLRRFDSNDFKNGIKHDCTGMIIATSPVHYDNILYVMAPVFGPDFPVVLPFEQHASNIALVVETQPRSGTHYTLNNLMACTGWQYATVFDEVPDTHTYDGVVNFTPDLNGNAYVVKSHYFLPLHFPQYRYVKTMFLYGWFFDSYYSHGRLYAGHPETYRLCWDSMEWQVLRGYLPLHTRWLDYIQTGFAVRYEDFALDFERQVQKLEAFLQRPLPGFQPPRMNPGRAYWSGDYSTLFDRQVFEELKEAFMPYIVRYYPEKVDEVGRI